MNWMHLGVGFGLDLLDWLLVGMIPLVGDVLDVVGFLYFYFKAKVSYVAAIGAIELIPGLDILPTWTAIGLYAARRQGGD